MCNNIIIGSECMGIWGINVIEYFIKKIYSDVNIIWNNTQECDIIVKSFSNSEKRWNRNYKKYIYWSGEISIPDKSKFETKKIYMLTTITKKVDNIYTPYVLYSPYIHKPRKYMNNIRPYLLAYCHSHKIKERELLFNLFVEKTSHEVCHSYGKCYGSYKNTQQKKIPGHWSNEELIDTYSQYKFVIAMENTIKDGYVTEKIINAFYSGAIPIYWGSSNINDFFNEKAFINVSNYSSFEDCVNYVVNMSEEEIQKMANEPIYNETNDLINLCNDEYNATHDNKVLNEYIEKFKSFLE